jgi:hypothetical protein
MFLLTVLPGIDQYISGGIEKLGETISLFTETDRKTQKAIRNMLTENPDLIQKFADLEVRSPGSLKKMGFGKVGDIVASVGPSMALQTEQRLGERLLSLEESGVGFQEFKTGILQNMIQENPGISPEQAESMFSQFMGIPTPMEIERSQLELDPLRRESEIAKKLMEFSEGGEYATDPISDYVDLFIAGEDDSLVTGSIMSHPILGPQFQAQLDLKVDERRAQWQKEIAELRATSTTPAAVRREKTLYDSTIAMYNAYKQTVEDWHKLDRPSRLSAIAGFGHQEELGAVRSAQRQLMGQIRALFFPGPLSRADERIINDIVGQPASIDAVRRDPSYIDSKLMQVEGLLEQKRLDLEAQGLEFRENQQEPIIEVTMEEYERATDELINSGASDTEIKNKTSRMRIIRR